MVDSTTPPSTPWSPPQGSRTSSPSRMQRPRSPTATSRSPGSRPSPAPGPGRWRRPFSMNGQPVPWRRVRRPGSTWAATTSISWDRQGPRRAVGRRREIVTEFRTW